MAAKAFKVPSLLLTRKLQLSAAKREPLTSFLWTGTTHRPLPRIMGQGACSLQVQGSALCRLGMTCGQTFRRARNPAPPRPARAINTKRRGSQAARFPSETPCPLPAGIHLPSLCATFCCKVFFRQTEADNPFFSGCLLHFVPNSICVEKIYPRARRVSAER